MCWLSHKNKTMLLTMPKCLNTIYQPISAYSIFSFHIFLWIWLFLKMAIVCPMPPHTLNSEYCNTEMFQESLICNSRHLYVYVVCLLLMLLVSTAMTTSTGPWTPLTKPFTTSHYYYNEQWE